MPEIDLIQLTMGLVQHRQQAGGQTDEAADLLGEHVSGADAEPTLFGVVVLVEP